MLVGDAPLVCQLVQKMFECLHALQSNSSCSCISPPSCGPSSQPPSPLNYQTTCQWHPIASKVAPISIKDLKFPAGFDWRLWYIPRRMTAHLSRSKDQSILRIKVSWKLLPRGWCVDTTYPCVFAPIGRLKIQHLDDLGEGYPAWRLL